MWSMMLVAFVAISLGLHEQEAYSVIASEDTLSAVHEFGISDWRQIDEESILEASKRVDTKTIKYNPSQCQEFRNIFAEYG